MMGKPGRSTDTPSMSELPFRDPKVTEKTRRLQQTLEEKQAERLRSIKETESQLQQQALAEYEEKVRALNTEVQEMVKNYTKATFPAEPQTGQAGRSVPEGQQSSPDPLEANIAVAEVSRLTLAMPELPGAGTDVEIEESVF